MRPGAPVRGPESIPGIRRRNIGQLTNVFWRRGGHAHEMEVRIELLQLRPLVGRVRVGGRAPDHFEGWLALLALLERVVQDELTRPADGLLAAPLAQRRQRSATKSEPRRLLVWNEPDTQRQSRQTAASIEKR